MAICCSGLLLHLNVTSSSCFMRKPGMVRYRLDMFVVGDNFWQGRCKGQHDRASCYVEGDRTKINRARDEHMNPDGIRIIKPHKRRADGLTLLWQIFALLL